MINSETYVEVYEVLKNLSKEDLKKIPIDILYAIKRNRSQTYVWKYNVNKSFQEQNISRETLAIIAYLNTEYLLNKKQKEYMKKIYKQNEYNAQKIKSEKYNTDVFALKREKTEILKNNSEKQLVVVKKSILNKIKDLIHSIFT